MSTGDKQPDAQPIYRLLALGVAVVCFLLAAAFTFAAPEQGLFPRIVCLIVGFIMLVIGKNGRWPPRSRKQ